jgi:hypothetical protein
MGQLLIKSPATILFTFLKSGVHLFSYRSKTMRLVNWFETHFVDWLLLWTLSCLNKNPNEVGYNFRDTQIQPCLLFLKT